MTDRKGRLPSKKIQDRNDQWRRDMHSELGGVFIAIHVPSAANLREHWRVRSARIKKQRDAGHIIGFARQMVPPCTVTFTRYGPRLLDCDALPFAFKGYRDGIASAWKTDDSPTSGITWKYQQVKTYPGCNGFRVEITK